MKRNIAAALAAGSCLFMAQTANADQWTDEANRQATMARMQAQDAANDRAQADRSFQAGLASQRSSSRSSGSSSGGSSGGVTALDGFLGAHGTEPLPGGPQSVVARHTLIVQIKETPAQVLARLEREAKAGNAQSAFDLARIYWTGYGGVKRDDVAAQRWFGVAAQAGNPDAQAQYGYMLYQGVGGAADQAQGIAQVAKAAAQGNAYGAGLHALWTLDIKSDRPQPAKVAGLVKAADAGFLFAQLALGTVVYDLGVGTAADFAKARHYSKLAADRGHPLAQTELGRMMASGRGGPKDPAGGAGYARKAAEAGHPAGMMLYGQLLGMGLGVPQDQASGWQWMRKAADAGNPQALGVVGAALLLGQGVPEDIPAGLRYLQLGAERGDAQAQAYWGTFRITGGFGVTINKSEGERLLKAAAAQGNQDAIDTLASPTIKDALGR
ncbi:MAG: tetratricopeptide repeat protein [Novosphingobium sp.]|uniref:tetratricopeptide repeat protein n=1 Tax=Novosphingobium sp. TaxID=1874826 RepID=UPI0032B9808A